MGRTACTEPQCLYKGALYLYLTVELYLYSPYGPYGLYRASVPVQGYTLSLGTVLHTGAAAMNTKRGRKWLCRFFRITVHTNQTTTYISADERIDFCRACLMCSVRISFGFRLKYIQHPFERFRSS